MDYLLLIAFALLPLAVWLDRRRSDAEASWANRALAVMASASAVASFAAAFYVKRHFLFDDAFITYRYADNLVRGCGITWNCGQAPVEGYTNFALVLVIAPLLKLGVDPLVASRALSVLAALGIAWLSYDAARRLVGAGRLSAILSGTTFLFLTSSAQIANLGIETVPYACALLAAVIFAGRLLEDEPDPRDAIKYAVAQLLVILLRPEGGFLLVLVSFLLLRTHGRARLRVHARNIALYFGVPCALYLLWKLVHFHGLLPAPFFVKATGSVWTHPLGVQSVLLFFATHWKLAALALLAQIAPSPVPRQRLFVALAIAAQIAFYQRVSTLMDIWGRFLYPLAPLLFLLALPSVVAFWNALLAWRTNGAVKVAIGWLTALLVFLPNTSEAFADLQTAMKGGPSPPAADDLGTKEQWLGKTLREYPGIEDVLIAFGDAGEIPYHSRALNLDTVGLNDNVISRERDLKKLVDYFFSRSPDLIIHPAFANGWVSGGHGALGHLDAWALDPRWDEYSYTGMVRTSFYGLHFFVRKQSVHAERLTAFVQSRIVEQPTSVCPFPIGTRRPPPPP